MIHFSQKVSLLKKIFLSLVFGKPKGNFAYMSIRQIDPGATNEVLGWVGIHYSLPLYINKKNQQSVEVHTIKTISKTTSGTCLVTSYLHSNVTHNNPKINKKIPALQIFQKTECKRKTKATI